MSRSKFHSPGPMADRSTGRFLSEQKEEILRQVAAGRTLVDVGRQYGVHPVTISRWRKAREGARKEGDSSGRSGLVARSTKPIDSASPIPVEQRELIVQIKGEHPEMGPAQIRNQLRRFHGISLSHKTIAKVLKQAGHKLEVRSKGQEEEALQRFEMTRPNELWTMDTKEFYVHDLKVYLVDILDDFSRFVVGHGLFRELSVELALSVYTAAVARHGKPERVLTDRGREFHVWRGESAFTKHLEEELVAHSLARPHHPQTCGKVEALHGTIQRELLDKVRFDSFSQVAQAISDWYDHYNFERTHMGIGGVTPADRYIGRVEKVLSSIERSLPSVDRQGEERRLPGERPVVLQVALVDGRLELWLAGKRVLLG